MCWVIVRGSDLTYEDYPSMMEEEDHGILLLLILIIVFSVSDNLRDLRYLRVGAGDHQCPAGCPVPQASQPCTRRPCSQPSRHEANLQ